MTTLAGLVLFALGFLGGFGFGLTKRRKPSPSPGDIDEAIMQRFERIAEAGDALASDERPVTQRLH